MPPHGASWFVWIRGRPMAPSSRFRPSIFFHQGGIKRAAHGENLAPSERPVRVPFPWRRLHLRSLATEERRRPRSLAAEERRLACPRVARDGLASPSTHSKLSRPLHLPYSSRSGMAKKPAARRRRRGRGRGEERLRLRLRSLAAEHRRLAGPGVAREGSAVEDLPPSPPPFSSVRLPTRRRTILLLLRPTFTYRSISLSLSLSPRIFLLGNVVAYSVVNLFFEGDHQAIPLCQRNGENLIFFCADPFLYMIRRCLLKILAKIIVREMLWLGSLVDYDPPCPDRLFRCKRYLFLLE
jgi:hypothetical protein